jgi:pimeloyl-ACP methyl ester carboxylesterase
VKILKFRPKPKSESGSPEYEVQFRTIHGYRRAFVHAGKGPAILLIHGIGDNSDTWRDMIRELARDHTVIAPDLLGHGQSDKPRADYSLGGYANGMRDLLTVLGIDKVTVVGHSFGGGVAMQFAYQFPERTERMILVAPGGLGPEVTPALRAVTLPGFHQLMGVVTLPVLRHSTVASMRLLAATRLSLLRDLDEAAAIVDSFKDVRGRRAIRHVVSGVVDWRGQIVTMADRAYLTAAMPMLVVWGADDSVIPARHATIAADIAPGAQVEVMPDAGHFPHKDHPQQFVRIVDEFVRSHPPATYHRGRWRALLKAGPTRPLPFDETAMPAMDIA